MHREQIAHSGGYYLEYTTRRRQSFPISLANDAEIGMSIHPRPPVTFETGGPETITAPHISRL